MSEAGAPVAHFDFANGELRGSHLALHASCLVHRSDGHVETIPLAAVASVRVAFERNFRSIRWGVSLVVLGVILYAIAAPLGSFASAAAGEMSTGGGQGVAGVLHALFRLLELGASLLPLLALVSALGGAALIALGVLGETILTVTLTGTERVYPARARNAQLLDFTEVLATQLMALKR